GNHPEHPRSSWRLDHRSTGHQARHAYARQQLRGGRSAGADRLRERPQVSITTLPAVEPPHDAVVRVELERAWATPPGFLGWLTSARHTSVATRYIVTAFGFFTLGGVLAALMRLQLARPNLHLIGPDLYNQIFTMHGSTMMFLFAVPIMEAFAIYLVPLMIGTRNVAFPRMN